MVQMPRGQVIDISHQTSALAVGDVVVEVSQDFYRPTDVVNLWGEHLWLRVHG